MTSLTLYTNPQSRGAIARWMMEEVGEPYEAVTLGFDGDMKSDDYLAINPMGKVPALKHGDTIVTEAAAICAYLADAFPDKRLAPEPGSADRGAYYRWLFFMAGPVEAAVTAKAFGLLVPDDKQQSAGYGTYDHVVDTLDGALEGRDHIAGDRFTAADLYVASHLGWGMMFGMIPKRPNFERYAALHEARPAAKRASELDQADTPKEQAAS